MRATMQESEVAVTPAVTPVQPEQRKVVVIGAGIVGICAALQLQRAGVETVVLDRQPPGEGASFANAAIIGEQHVAPVAMPGMLRKLPGMLMNRTSPLAVRWNHMWQLAPWLARFFLSARPSRVQRIAGALADLLDGSVGAYEHLLKEAGAPEMIRKTGWLTLYETRKGFAQDAGKLDLERRLNQAFEIYPSEALRQFDPAIGDGSRFHKGVYYPDVGHVLDNYRVVQILARHFRRLGGRILREEVSSFAFEDGRLAGVRTQRANHICDDVVIAAGAWSRALTRQLGSDPPLETERGYSLTLSQPGVMPRLPINSAEMGMVCTPLSRGLRIGGTVELASLDAPPDWRRADILFQNARRLLPDLQGEPEERWMGCRPSMPDSLPVISRAPRHPNAVFAFGHGHCGLMLGARTGELVRDLILDREPVVDPTPFRVDRF